MSGGVLLSDAMLWVRESDRKKKGWQDEQNERIGKVDDEESLCVTFSSEEYQRDIRV